MTTQTEQDEAVFAELDACLLASNELPHLYFNDFLTSISTGDVLIILKRNNAPIAILNTTYTVAKTLAQALGRTIVKLEDKTGQMIMTTHEIEACLTENDAASVEVAP